MRSRFRVQGTCYTALHFCTGFRTQQPIDLELGSLVTVFTRTLSWLIRYSLAQYHSEVD